MHVWWTMHVIYRGQSFSISTSVRVSVPFANSLPVPGPHLLASFSLTRWVTWFYRSRKKNMTSDHKDFWAIEHTGKHVLRWTKPWGLGECWIVCFHVEFVTCWSFWSEVCNVQMDAMTPRRGASEANGSVERILTQVSLKCTTEASWAYIRVGKQCNDFWGFRV